MAALALRLGCTAFGGPAAHIAMLEEEVVGRRGWLTRDEFLDLLGATNLIPGPNSTEMVMQVGLRRAGWPGLVLAGLGFITPAALLTLGFAWAYVRFGALPTATGLLAGIKPAVLAIVLLAVWRLGQTALKKITLLPVAAAVFGLYLSGASEIALLLGSGLIVALIAGSRRPPAVPAAGLAWFAPPLAAAAVGTTAPAAGAWAVGLYFLKIGSVLFGSGYVLLAFLQQGVVEHYRWVTERQLIDAVAVGQFTPGPVFCTATFIGYLVAGGPGALAATVGIFLPGFVFVALIHRQVARLRESRWTSGFLDGVNAAAVALMAAVLLELGKSALPGVPWGPAWPAWVIFGASLAVLFGTRLNSAWVVLGGALAGLALMR